MEIRPRQLLKYIAENGQCPFDDWLDGLRDKRTQAVVVTRLNRVVQGNFGFCKKLEAGIFELKIDFGPGFRVYFAEDGDSIVVLLCGGDKSTQINDIKKARQYWTDYQRE